MRRAAAGVAVVLVLVVLIPVLLGSALDASSGATSSATSPAATPTPGQLGRAEPSTLTPLFAWVPPGGFPDTFPWGQCTYWAAYNHLVTWKGNAWQWLANAAAKGISSTDAPAVGAIAVYPKAPGYNREFGHVAIVIAVTSTTYTVSEMNYSAFGVVDTRTIALPDPKVEGFIP